MLLSLLLHKEIEVLGWSMRVLLLFVAFWVMFCNVGWEELKRTSWFIKYVETRNDGKKKG